MSATDFARNFYNDAQAFVGLNPAQRGTLGVANKSDPYLQKGWSYEDISAKTGVPVDQIRAYADRAYPGYGIKTAKPTKDQTTTYSGGASSADAQKAAQENAAYNK